MIEELDLIVTADEEAEIYSNGIVFPEASKFFLMPMGSSVDPLIATYWPKLPSNVVLVKDSTWLGSEVLLNI